jgi:hypothetical protein
VDAVRVSIGLLARGVFWACVWLVVGNALAQAVRDEQYVLASFELAGFPLTFLLYPFLQPAVGNAWPWADGHTLILVLVAAVVAYPISTFVGGPEPVAR